MDRSRVSGKVAVRLQGRSVVGVDRVHARVARAIAACLDDPDVPHHAVAKLSHELRCVITEVEGVAPGV